MSSHALVKNGRTVSTRLALAALFALIAAGSCTPRATGKGVLPPPNPAAVTPAPNQPERPFDLQADGVLSRPVFRTEEAAPFRAEIVDLLIPPGKATVLKHEGVVVVETREGSGVAVAQEKRLPLGPGATFGLSHGQTARIENGGKEPLLLRVYRVAMP